MSKRKLIQLVNEKRVNGWDDPRLLTIAGLRRRGVTPSALRMFAYNIGITKYPRMTRGTSEIAKCPSFKRSERVRPD